MIDIIYLVIFFVVFFYVMDLTDYFKYRKELKQKQKEYEKAANFANWSVKQHFND